MSYGSAARKGKKLIGENNYNLLLEHGYFPIQIDYFKMAFESSEIKQKSNPIH